MAIIDIILIIILIGYFISGFSFGLIKSLGSLIGTFVGIFLAAQWYDHVAEYLLPIFFGNQNLARVVCFLLVLVIVDVIITIVFYIIDKMIGWLPMIKGLNKVGGGIIGVFKGALFLAILIYILSLFPWWQTLTTQLENSFVADYAISFINKIMPFVPKAIEGAKSLI